MAELRLHNGETLEVTEGRGGSVAFIAMDDDDASVGAYLEAEEAAWLRDRLNEILERTEVQSG